MIEDCKKLVREMNTAVIHIFGEINRCANKLAKIGGMQGEQVVRILVPPEDLRANMCRGVQKSNRTV